jgi:hypothetical protein
MKHRIGLGTAATVMIANSVLLVPALQARQCSGNGDIVGSFGYTASRSGYYLLGATAAGNNAPNGASLMIPVPATPPGTAMVGVPVTPPGTSGSTGTTTSFIGSNTSVGNLLTGLENPDVFAGVGRLFADGMGNLYASPTTGLMTNILAGSYTVSTNCYITMTISDPFASTTTGTTPGGTTTTATTTTASPATLTGYVSASGLQIDAIGTNGALVRLRRISQGGNCNNSYLNGAFTVTGSGFYTASAGNGLVVSGTTGTGTGTGTGTVGTGTTTTTTNPTTPCASGQSTPVTTTGTVITPTCVGAFSSGVTTTLGTPFNVLARFVADGSGNLTTDVAGQQASTGQAITGSYAVNADCTGTAHMVDAAGITRNISFVVVNQADQCYIGSAPQGSARQELDFVFSDSGVTGSGVAQLQ